MRVRRSLFVLISLLAALVATVLVPGGVAEAAPKQVLLFDHTASHVKNAYFEPKAAQPKNYVRPVNFRDGRVYLRLDVQSKPTAKALWAHLCLWRHQRSGAAIVKKFRWETCSKGKAATITTAGVHWFDLGTPGRWWKKGGTYDWNYAGDIVRIMLKDPVTRKLMITSRCGAACYTRADIDQHLPIKTRAEVILVAKGATLSPPAHWKGCPKTWSAAC